MCHATYSDGSIASVDAHYGKGHCRIWGLELCRNLRHESIAENIQEIADFALSAGVHPEANTPSGVISRTLEGEHVRVCVLFNSSDCAQKVAISENAATLCGAERSGGAVLLLPGKTEVVIQKKR